MHRNHAELLGVPEMEEKQKNKRYVLRKLFFASLYLSTFTFGGGYMVEKGNKIACADETCGYIEAKTEKKEDK